jgi:large subunit ribosomal protein L18
MKNLKNARKRSPSTARRLKRKMGIRKKISGTAERPRVTVFKSAKHIYAQAIDDETGTTLASASTMDKGTRGDVTGLKKRDAATKVGEELAKRMVEKGVKNAVFDRNGYKYHGRVAAVADGAREGGVQL